MRNVVGIVLAVCLVAATLARPRGRRAHGDDARRLEQATTLRKLAAPVRRSPSTPNARLPAFTAPAPAPVTVAAPIVASCERATPAAWRREPPRPRAVRSRDPPRG